MQKSKVCNLLSSFNSLTRDRTHFSTLKMFKFKFKGTVTEPRLNPSSLAFLIGSVVLHRPIMTFHAYPSNESTNQQVAVI